MLPVSHESEREPNSLFKLNCRRAFFWALAASLTHPGMFTFWFGINPMMMVMLPLTAGELNRWESGGVPGRRGTWDTCTHLPRFNQGNTCPLRRQTSAWPCDLMYPVISRAKSSFLWLLLRLVLLNQSWTLPQDFLPRV